MLCGSHAHQAADTETEMEARGRLVHGWRRSTSVITAPPEALQVHRVEEESGQNQDGGGGGRPERHHQATEASRSPQHEPRLQQQIIVRDIQLKLLLFYFYVFGMSHQGRHQHSSQSAGLRGFPPPSLLISAMDLQRLKTPSFPIG